METLNLLYIVTGLRHGKRVQLSVPCSKIEAISLRNWTRDVFGYQSVYTDIQIREFYG